MRRLALALTLAAAAQPAAALDLPPLCQALHGLADAARQTHEPQRVSASAGPAGALACRTLADNPAQRAFCAAAADAAGVDGPDMLPWRVFDCVDNLGASPQLVTVDGNVGPKHKKRLTQLAANLGHGVRLDISRAAAGYDLVVWASR